MKKIDLFQEEIGTVFWTRNHSEARLIQCIGRNLYKLEVVDIFTRNILNHVQTRIYNQRGKILQADMRTSHPLDLIEKQ